MNFKSSEELRSELGLNQSQFSQMLGLSRRTYNARLMQEQDWKLHDLIKLCAISDGRILVQSGQSSYIVSIAKID